MPEKGMNTKIKIGSSRHRKLNSKYKIFTICIYEENHFLCYTEIAKELKNENNIDVSANIINDSLKKRN